jgi:hypothetical protein
LSVSTARGLDYFCYVVAPRLGGMTDTTFWTTTVMQLATTEDAAVHGILAVTLLDENFKPSWKPVDNEAALKHYNQAMKLVASQQLSTASVLVMTLLFTCIEFLRGNEKAAILHCRHGALLTHSSEEQADDITAMVRQLSIFPFFFSSGDFPAPVPFNQPTQFETSAQASSAMDELMGQSIRLVRSFDSFRLGPEGATVPVEASAKQLSLLRSLKLWRTAYDDLVRTGVSIDQKARVLMQMQYHVCWIWTCIALQRDETASDSFQVNFSHIVEIARRTIKMHSCQQPWKFTFSMGISPLLHFVVLKCRHLPLRLEALQLLRSLGRRRESLWDAPAMCKIGEVIIEREHGPRYMLEMETGEWDYPAEEARVRDSYVDNDAILGHDAEGNEVTRRQMHLFVLEGGNVVKKSAWIELAN